MKLFYLGPQGSFTYQAARLAADNYLSSQDNDDETPELVSCASEREIFKNVESANGWGIIAWENNVEGYVATNLDRLMNSHDVAGVERLSLDIQFDAFVRSDHTELTEVTAHPHGLAQCTQFIEQENLREVGASSNSAACKNLRPNQVALAPHGSGQLFGLEVWKENVQDYERAHTDFLLLKTRDEAATQAHVRRSEGTECESIITVIPLSTGPGVIANLLDVFRDKGLNMTSLISRPIKGVDGTYSFIITVDAAPWDNHAEAVLREIEEHSDWLKILAVYPSRDTQRISAHEWNLPHMGKNPLLSQD